MGHIVKLLAVFRVSWVFVIADEPQRIADEDKCAVPIVRHTVIKFTYILYL